MGSTAIEMSGDAHVFLYLKKNNEGSALLDIRQSSNYSSLFFIATLSGLLQLAS